MTTPTNAETESHHHSTREIESRESAVWRLLECLVGGVAAGIVFLLSLPMLADIARPLQSLLPTGLLFAFLFVWLFLWLLTAASHERVVT